MLNPTQWKRYSLAATVSLVAALVLLFPSAPEQHAASGTEVSLSPPATLTRFDREASHTNYREYKPDSKNNVTKRESDTLGVTEPVSRGVASQRPVPPRGASVKSFYCDSSLTDYCGYEWHKCTGEVVSSGCSTGFSQTDLVPCDFIPTQGLLCPVPESR